MPPMLLPPPSHTRTWRAEKSLFLPGRHGRWPQHFVRQAPGINHFSRFIQRARLVRGDTACDRAWPTVAGRQSHKDEKTCRADHIFFSAAAVAASAAPLAPAVGVAEASGEALAASLAVADASAAGVAWTSATASSAGISTFSAAACSSALSELPHPARTKAAVLANKSVAIFFIGNRFPG